MNMCYVTEYDGYMFSRLNTATGYRDSVGTHVYVRDWQGNIRAVVRKGDDGSTVLEQATYYYPYGMPMAESTNPTANRNKYTGKEVLTDKSFNCYDYGARFYDPATCLWLSPDPHSSDYAPMSHYSMCAGDPINFVDPSGKIIQGITNKDAALVVKDIHSMFRDTKFKNFKKLIRQSGEKQNSLRLAPISSEDLSTALSGITLNADQNALVELNLILRNMGKNLIEMDPITHLLI